MQKVPTLVANRRFRDAIIVVASAAAQLTYVLVSRAQNGTFGFPLDDSWIFQTYARNLAQFGEWSFIVGTPSTGSTSVLWTPLLVPGHLLPIDPVLWAYFVGWLALAALGLGASRLFPEDQPLLSLGVGLAVAVEWHLVWAAASGMETALFAALVLWFWVWVLNHDPAEAGFRWQNGLTLGLFGGLLMLARPEGVLALAVAGLYGLLRPGDLWKRFRWGAVAGVGLAVMLLMFFGLNWSISGVLWPNTFYAKQTEYSVLWQVPYLLRFIEQVQVALVGPHLLAIPGLLAGLWLWARRRPLEWIYLLPLIWVVLHWALYAFRLPVTYQHGRYAIPTIAILVIYGVRGVVEITRPNARDRAVRLLSRAWVVALAVSFPLFTAVLGAPAYTEGVAFIQNDMVSTAQWLEDYRDGDTVVAAHDIGALGYYSPGALIDLAGLVSPEVIPFMLDAGRLSAHIVENADLLIMFPGWGGVYDELAVDPRFCEIWSAADKPGYEISSEELGAMTVYAVTADGDCSAVNTR